MRPDIEKLIGVGAKFPFEPNLQGGVSSSSSIDRINQSLLIIFETRKGSRLMMPDFGSSLSQYKFDPFDEILVERLREIIKEDIRKWEPRISLKDIKFLDSAEAKDRSTLYISINYEIKDTGVSGSFVYPFRQDVYNMSEDTTVR